VTAGTVAGSQVFDLLEVAHVLLAVAALVVLVVLRSSARAAAGQAETVAPPAARSFTGRPELAGRLVHLVPLTGIGLVAASEGTVAFGDLFVVAGGLLWLVAAIALESVAFPAQREVAGALPAAREDARVPARRMEVAVEVAAAALVAAAIVMLVHSAL
jgi:hypothetical protein